VHIDARTLPDATLLEGDLCIVGAGPAGIALALEWEGRGERVLLLEGGGFQLERALQDRFRGESVGLPYYPLESARLHFFGGASNHWGGFCAPFDPIDFQERAWVPRSGWPFGGGELEPFYPRAQELVELGPHDFDLDSWRSRDPRLVPLPLDPSKVWTKMWQFSRPPTPFGRRYRERITGSPNVHLFTHANVVEVVLHPDGRAVSELRVSNLAGRTHRIRAHRYVLACGAIQNARLLLASNGLATRGVGNDADLVGRHFMEHVEMPVGELVLARPDPVSLYRLDWGVTRGRGELAITAALQRERELLNGSVELVRREGRTELRGTFQELPPDVLAGFMEYDEMVERGEIVPDRPGAPTHDPWREFTLVARHEQAPHPDSRVMLSTERDALAVPRVRLDWRLSALEFRSMRETCRELGREVGRSGAGRIRLLEWLRDEGEAWPDFVSGGWHHMGTTRMHADPRQGVVDPHCRVHGIGNLYVAGASVFPTGGCANPTLTLLALSLRLSDHLKAVRPGG
jgi:choline dehydrogenase-like flavoprotein